MPLPRVWLTVERLLIALVPIAGTLIDQQCARRNDTWLLSSHGLQDCGGSTPHREREQAPALQGSDPVMGNRSVVSGDLPPTRKSGPSTLACQKLFRR